MDVLIGTDIIDDEQFLSISKNMNVLKKIFHRSEIKENPKRLCSIFALKESTIKALNINTTNWHNIEVNYEKKGKPLIILSELIKPKGYHSIICSSSHSNGFTIAVVIILSDDKN